MSVTVAQRDNENDRTSKHNPEELFSASISSRPMLYIYEVLPEYPLKPLNANTLSWLARLDKK